MNVLFVALPVAIVLGLLGLIACIYCIRNGQYDDLDSESIRILVDDAIEESSPEHSSRIAGDSDADPP